MQRVLTIQVMARCRLPCHLELLTYVGRRPAHFGLSNIALGLTLGSIWMINTTSHSLRAYINGIIDADSLHYSSRYGPRPIALPSTDLSRRPAHFRIARIGLTLGSIRMIDTTHHSLRAYINGMIDADSPHYSSHGPRPIALPPTDLGRRPARFRIAHIGGLTLGSVRMIDTILHSLRA
jgi:hypothetical protein